MKEEVLKLISIFGLRIDYDQWDTKGWIRVQDVVLTQMEPLILYKEDIESIGIQFAKDELCSYLMDIGEYGFKVRLNDLIKL